MRKDAAQYLTRAFRAYGSLSPNNEVTKVTRFEPFAGGNSGRKLILSVEYARAEDGLATDLFAKFSRDFDDAFRDRRRFELEAEVRLAALSHHSEFPVRVAKPFFADFHHESGTGLLITERIALGKGNIEPLHPKCMDHLLPDPLEYYRELVSAQARLAAAHHSGRLSPDVERLFPYEAESAMADMPIPQEEGKLRRKVAAWAEFAAHCPQLMPPNLGSVFFERMERDVLALHRHESAVRHFLHHDSRFVALCHWNTNIDNAWFWRDDDGGLHCGLLDWGMVRQMNVGYGLWGGLSASGLDFLGRELDGLLRHYVDELNRHGGPRVEPEELALHFNLSVALLGMALMLDTPALVTSRVPDIANASGPHDPLLRADPVSHGFLQVSINFLNLWERRGFGASLQQMLDQPGTR